MQRIKRILKKKRAVSLQPLNASSVVDKVALGHVFLRVCRFPPSIFYHSFILFFIQIYMLVLTERENSKAWKPSQKQRTFRYREAIDRKAFFPQFSGFWSYLCSTGKYGTKHNQDVSSTKRMWIVMKRNIDVENFIWISNGFIWSNLSVCLWST